VVLERRAVLQSLATAILTRVDAHLFRMNHRDSRIFAA
jgi:hypothetical protein